MSMHDHTPATHDQHASTGAHSPDVLDAHALEHVEEHLVADRVTLSRRRALGVFGVASAGLLAATTLRGPFGTADADAASTACATLTPAKEQGPYFVEEKLNRSNITTDTKTGAAQAGMPLTFTCTLLNENDGCAPLAGATVDIWHANPAGTYSDESSENTAGTNWLRGYQVSDANGKVTFTTIYPGWYAGLAVHIHARIRLFDSSGNTTYDSLTRLYFDPTLTNTVYTTSPYASRGTPTTTNSTDRTYGSDGAACLMPCTGSNSTGYTGTFTFGLQTSAVATSTTTTSGAASSTSTGSTSTGTTTGTTTSGSTSTTTSTSSTDTSVTVSLPYVAWHRTATGRRQLRIKVRTKETTKVVARIRRGSKTVKRSSATSVPKGTHGYTLSLPSTTATGRATLEITVKDAAGNTKSLTKIIHVPAKA